jgi:hypothetical protein
MTRACPAVPDAEGKAVPKVVVMDEAPWRYAVCVFARVGVVPCPNPPNPAVPEPTKVPVTPVKFSALSVVK